MTDAPQRIQRRRVKGWRLPPNTICVDRSTRWGNPFIVGRHGGHGECVRLYRALMQGTVCFDFNMHHAREQKKYIEYVRANIEQLRGKNLACWCKPCLVCHADVLLRLANREPAIETAND